MDATPFFVVMSAVAAANILSFGFVWALYQVSKRERDGGQAGPAHLLILTFCLLFIAGGVYLGATA